MIALVFALLAQDRHSFEWKFKQGEAFELSYSVRVRLEPENWKEFAAALGETDLTLTVQATGTVDRSDTEGLGLIKVTFDKAKLEGKYLGGRVAYAFDRDQPLRDVTATTESAKLLGEAVKDLADITKSPMEVVVDSFGVLEVRGLTYEALALGMGDKRPFGVLLPKRAAAVGDAWEEELELLGKPYRALDATVKGKAKHTFESVEGSLAKISTVEQGKTENKPLTIAVKGSAASVFDLKSGYLQSCKGSRELRFEFPSGDQKAAIKATIEYALSLRRK